MVLHTIECLYVRQQQSRSVISLKQIQTLKFNLKALQMDALHNYVKLAVVGEEHQVSLYTQLGHSCVPGLADLKMIRKLIDALPTQCNRNLTEFYLQRTYHDASLTQMLLGVLF